jgi:hypothetical protein
VLAFLLASSGGGLMLLTNLKAASHLFFLPQSCFLI